MGKFRLAALGLLSAVLALSAQAAYVVKTDSGRVQGYYKTVLGTERPVEVFQALPYAEPPVGELRFAPAVPVKPWNGLRDATVAAPACVQPGGGSEDCLYLNIYRPAGTVRSHGRPVMVWLGSSNVSGAATDFDGSRFAVGERILVVTVQYRLGALGFLNLPGLGAQAGNFGLGDILEALRWVQKNIAAFGGDPKNVVLAGQGQAAANIGRLLVDSRAKGLFSGVILQSTDGRQGFDSAKVSRERSDDFVDASPCAGEKNLVTCLRQVSVDNVRIASERVDTWKPTGSAPAATLIARGAWNKVAVLMGANSDEGSLIARQAQDWSEDQYDEWVKSLLGNKAEQVLQRYPSYKYAAADAVPHVASDLATDSGLRGWGGCSGLDLAQKFLAGGAPSVYVYEFQDGNAPHFFDKNLRLGAYHGAELPYLWPDTQRFHDLFLAQNDAQQDLSDLMRRYWGLFVRFGSPNTQGLPVWRSYKTRDRMVMALKPGEGANGPRLIPESQVLETHKCSLWQPLLPVTESVRAKGTSLNSNANPG